MNRIDRAIKFFRTYSDIFAVLLILIAALSGTQYLIDLAFRQSGTPEWVNLAVQTIWISILASILFHFWERTQFFTTLIDLIEPKISESTARIEQMFESRSQYGLKGVVAKVSEDNKGNWEQSLFDSLGEGDKFFWHNTYLDSPEIYANSIIEASKKGAIINILLLNPKSASIEFRRIDAYASQYDSREQFSEYIAHRHDTIKQRTNGTDNINIRYFDGAANCPFIVIQKANGHVSTYTGFYLDKPSRELPYLEWISTSENEMFTSALTYFNKKWTQSTDEYDENPPLSSTSSNKKTQQKAPSKPTNRRSIKPKSA